VILQGLSCRGLEDKVGAGGIGGVVFMKLVFLMRGL